MRIEAPDDEVAKSERFFDCASGPEIGERSPQKHMSGLCAQNDDASQGRAAADGSSAKYRALLAMAFVDGRKPERDPSLVLLGRDDAELCV